MISSIYQTSLQAAAVGGASGNEDVVTTGTTIILPPHANFSAQTCLFWEQSIPSRIDSLLEAKALIIRYITFIDGGFEVHWLNEGGGDFPPIVSGQDAYAVSFALRVSAVLGGIQAASIVTIFIES